MDSWNGLPGALWKMKNHGFWVHWTKNSKLQSGNISPRKPWTPLQYKLVKDAWKEFHDRYVITHGDVRPMVMWHIFAKYFMNSLCSANLK